MTKKEQDRIIKLSSLQHFMELGFGNAYFKDLGYLIGQLGDNEIQSASVEQLSPFLESMGRTEACLLPSQTEYRIPQKYLNLLVVDLYTKLTEEK